jgi:hypothetical protein
MSFNHVNATVTTVANPILTVKSGAQRSIAIQIQNTHSAAIFIGDSAITTSGATIGRSIPAGGALQIWANSGDVIYAISAATTAAGAVVITYSA